MASLLYNINSSTNESLPSTGLTFGGNARTLAFQGTFNTIINIEASYDGGSNYISLTDSDGSALNIQAETIINISVGSGVKLRFVTSGTSGTSDVDVYMA
jgi:hypothetical protein